MPDSITPYLEESTKRVFETNELTGDLQLTCGIDVERLNIDPKGVTASSFTQFTHTDLDNRAHHIALINQHAVESVENREIVWDREESLTQNSHAIWVMTDGTTVSYPHPLAGNEMIDQDAIIRLPSDVYVYERVPFHDPIQSIPQLETELETALAKLTDGNISIKLTN